MKRLLCLLMISASSLTGLAQEPESPAAIAAKREAARQAEEQYKIMASDIKQLTDSNQALQEKIGTLTAQLERLREEQNRQAALIANTGLREDLKHLAEKIQEVDRKRESDKQVISEEIKASIQKLSATIKDATASVPAPRPRPVHNESKASSPAADRGFAYTVKSGDTLPKIVKIFNAEFTSKGMKTITRQQVKDANPSVNFDKIQSGQKIIIPDPSSLN